MASIETSKKKVNELFSILFYIYGDMDLQLSK